LHCGMASVSLHSLIFSCRLIEFRSFSGHSATCDLVVSVPGYTTEKYCASCEVRTECIYVM
jgi:hypothetical protein